MKMNNMMVQELNDTQLDMVNGGGVLSGIIDSVKSIAPSITGGIKQAASDLWETAKFIVNTEDTLY